ncbi:hypothetical protein CITRIK5_30556 [Citricoccus sp. K5]|nr:hypothetical protein CITRIK5_30556 [Citricoccus sp. K5]
MAVVVMLASSCGAPVPLGPVRRDRGDRYLKGTAYTYGTIILALLSAGASGKAPFSLIAYLWMLRPFSTPAADVTGIRGARCDPPRLEVSRCGAVPARFPLNGASCR